jgi:hypothetical protein
MTLKEAFVRACFLVFLFASPAVFSQTPVGSATDDRVAAPPPSPTVKTPLPTDILREKDLPERVEKPLGTLFKECGMDMKTYEPKLLPPRFAPGTGEVPCAIPFQVHAKAKFVDESAVFQFLEGLSVFPDPNIRMGGRLSSISITGETTSDGENVLSAYFDVQGLAVRVPEQFSLFPDVLSLKEADTPIWETMLSKPKFRRGLNKDGTLTGSQMWLQEITRLDSYQLQGFCLAEGELLNFVNEMKGSGKFEKVEIKHQQTLRTAMLQVPLTSFLVHLTPKPSEKAIADPAPPETGSGVRDVRNDDPLHGDGDVPILEDNEPGKKWQPDEDGPPGSNKWEVE